MSLKLNAKFEQVEKWVDSAYSVDFKSRDVEFFGIQVDDGRGNQIDSMTSLSFDELEKIVEIIKEQEEKAKEEKMEEVRALLNQDKVELNEQSERFMITEEMEARADLIRKYEVEVESR